MDEAWWAVGHLAAAVMMLALAALVLWLAPVHRALLPFVTFLVLRAATLVAQAIAPFLGDLSEAALANSLPYVDIALAGALLWFVSLYPARRSRIWRVAVAIVTATAMGVWAFARCAVVCGEIAGPASFLYSPSPVVAGLAATFVVLTTRGLAAGTTRTSARIVAVALAIEAVLAAGISLAYRGGATYPWDVAAALAAVLVIVGSIRGMARVAFVILGLAAAASGIAGARWMGEERVLLFGAWRLVLPLLVGYALARHRLLDVDLSVKLAAKRATLGAIFAGVFFVVTEGGAYVLGSQFGVLAGILAVGVLVPLLGPLRRGAERFTDFLPGEDGAPRDLPIERRRQIYTDFAHQAWADGSLAREERAFLDKLRVRLALPAEDAIAAESEASRSKT